MSKIKVLLVAAEAAPLVKVGGLGDVMGALPKALHKLNVDVRVVMPKYGIINEQKYPLTKVAGNVTVPFNKRQEKITIYQTSLPNSQVPVYLVDNFKYLGKNGVYFETETSTDNPHREAERFTFLARSSIACLEALKWYPDIIHCQDWHVGLVPILLKILAKKNKRLAKIKTLFTIHNLEYQGWYKTANILNILGITINDYPTLKIQKHEQIISVQQGILTSDFINTVSPTYAKEILTPEFGAGLETTLQQRKASLTGILNGIDTDRFNPATDTHLAVTYTADNISNKQICKQDLQKTCYLPREKNIPLLGIVTRLADQKGVDLIYDIADELAKENLQFVLLGTGDPKLEKMMREISAKWPKKMQARIEFSVPFAQQVYAGSDMFLMPSKYEPCGLGQMIAMRYGTVPIVRATGGLKDTVTDYNQKTGTGDGFVFINHKSQELLEAIKRALQVYQDQEKWYNMVRHIMQKDFSWNASAKKYLALYKRLTK